MTWSHVVVLDQGTHSTRAIIYNRLGDSVFKSQQEIDLFYRDSSHIEQNGKHILISCQEVLSDAHAYIKKNQLKDVCVAITTQRSTVIAWNVNTGEALTPALSWLDTRAQNELKNFSIDERLIKEKTGLPLSAHYGASKLQWLLRNDEQVIQAKQQQRLMFGPLSAYLIFNLVEQQPCYVDYANAHRTLLWNLQTKQWDADLLQAFHIDKADLPVPAPNMFDYGKLKDFGYPLVLVNGDQNSAVYGYGKLKENTTFINIGTGGFVLAQTKQRSVLNTKLLTSITYSSGSEQEYALEGTVNGAGAAMTWAESAWGIQDIESIPWNEIENVPVFLNTVGGLGSPFWQSNIPPRFLDDNKTHKNYSSEQRMAALMESIVFLLTINIEEMHKHEISTHQILVAGGMSKDEHLCQCLANLNSVPVIVSNFKEATSRGAAWLAMHRPNWGILESRSFSPIHGHALQSRYDTFKSAIYKLVH
jgi:glycerol kinase